MRWHFNLALTELARRDDRIVLLWGDVGGGLWQDFTTEFPHRSFNVGIWEQATISMAAGLAMGGFRPVVYSITPFLIERALEQIKLDVAQQMLPVGIVGHSNAECGPTHQELDARRTMSMMPAIRSYFPKSKEDIRPIVQILDLECPWFIALSD